MYQVEDKTLTILKNTTSRDHINKKKWCAFKLDFLVSSASKLVRQEKLNNLITVLHDFNFFVLKHWCKNMSNLQ